MPKVTSVPPVDNGVLKGYQDSFGPPDWVSQPHIAILEAGSPSDQVWIDGTELLYKAGTSQLLAGLCAFIDSQGPVTITWDRLS